MANQSKIIDQRGPDIHPYMRVAVIVLRLFYTTDFHDISRKTGLDNPYSTFAQVIKQENLPYARSTVERIAKLHSSPSIPRPIVRKTQ